MSEEKEKTKDADQKHSVCQLLCKVNWAIFCSPHFEKCLTQFSTKNIFAYFLFYISSD